MPERMAPVHRRQRQAAPVARSERAGCPAVRAEVKAARTAPGAAVRPAELGPPEAGWERPKGWRGEEMAREDRGQARGRQELGAGRKQWSIQ